LWNRFATSDVDSPAGATDYLISYTDKRRPSNTQGFTNIRNRQGFISGRVVKHLHFFGS
jgi:hypothetical protein